MYKKSIYLSLFLVILAAFMLTACTGSKSTNPTAEATQATSNQDDGNTQADTNTSSGETTTDIPGQPPSGGQPPDGEPPTGGQPPSGEPPSGGPPPGGAPAGSGTGATSGSDGLATATGAYTLDGGTATESGQIYTASNEDQSGVYVLNGGVLTLSNSSVVTSGDTSSDENSSFYGLNAGILAAGSSTITVNGGSISTTGSGANGAFATGEGSSVTLNDVTINASGDGGHGVMATQGGSVTLNNVTMNTSGAHSAPIATDRGSGKITSTGGSVITSGTDSPCYYSTGILDITGNTCTATGSEIAVIEGANSVSLTDSDTSSSVENKWGVMIYQSMSGDAEGTQGTFSMTGGSLTFTASSGPLFFVTNSTGIINLQEVDVTAASGLLVQAGGTERWGTSGSNGGTVIFTADEQSLTGDMTADNISSLTITLQNNSSLTGAINSGNTAQSVSLSLDAGSTWNVTADSYLTVLNDSAGISGTMITNITGNGHTVYYDPSANPELNGLTYALVNGGTLEPMP